MAGFNNDVCECERAEYTRTSVGQFMQCADGTNTVGYYTSDGTPEGAITANIGSFCIDGTNGILYRKDSGTGNTGWVAFAPYQIAGTSASDPADASDAGVLSLDSNYFSISANGWATLSNPPSNQTTNVDWFDDMNYHSYNSNSTSVWNRASTNAAVPTGVQQHFGVAASPSGDSSMQSGLCITTGGAEITLDWYVKMASTTPGAGEDCRFGFTNIYFLFGVGYTNWRMVANSGGTTNNDSSIAYSTDWVKLTLVVNAAGTSVEFFVDDVSGGTVTTNLPATSTAQRLFFFGGNVTSGHYVDWVRFRQTRGS